MASLTPHTATSQSPEPSERTLGSDVDRNTRLAASRFSSPGQSENSSEPVEIDEIPRSQSRWSPNTSDQDKVLSGTGSQKLSSEVALIGSSDLDKITNATDTRVGTSHGTSQGLPIASSESVLPKDETDSMTLPQVTWPGPWLRLQIIDLELLGVHPETSTAISTTGFRQLRDVVTRLLAEAIDLAKVQLPTWKQTGSKSYAGVTSPVKFFRKDVQIPQSNNRESWFARESIHVDAAERGTGSWDEFVIRLRDNHSYNEGRYTQDIYDTRQILDYGVALTDAGLTAHFEGLTLKVFEMAHEIPVFHNRVFATMVLTGSISPDEFIVAQIPVNLTECAGAFYSNGKNLLEDAIVTNSKMKKRVVIGEYSSVEYVQRYVEDGQSKIRWRMATTSDAKGHIPLFIQKLAMPGKIAKDVELLVEWLEKQRSQKD